VIALNYYGESPVSDVSAGTKIITKPDPPRNFKENNAKRTKNALEFSWEHGASDGGAPVIDFRIYQNQDGSEYELIRSGVQDMFLYINTLSPGVYYGFKLQSRNIFGLGDLSDEFVILCATFPETPLAPVTVGIEAEVSIQWQEPQTNGSPITSYQIYIRAHDGQYHEETDFCLSSI
jgi:hypothetical protein